MDLCGDDSFIFNTYSEIRHIGDQDFSGDAGVYDARMESGLVSVDNNSDGLADREIMLGGLDSFGILSQNWLKLPDGLDFVWSGRVFLAPVPVSAVAMRGFSS